MIIKLITRALVTMAGLPNRRVKVDLIKDPKWCLSVSLGCLHMNKTKNRWASPSCLETLSWKARKAHITVKFPKKAKFLTRIETIMIIHPHLQIPEQPEQQQQCSNVKKQKSCMTWTCAIPKKIPAFCIFSLSYIATSTCVNNSV